MPSASANAFIGRATPPTEQDLGEVLADSKPLWDALIAGLKADHGIEPEPWNSYSPKAGWSLPLRLGKRRIVYLSPMRGAFLASFALGDKAVAAAQKGRLSKATLQLIAAARRYAEGTAVRIEVRQEADVGQVKRLAAIKLEN